MRTLLLLTFLIANTANALVIDAFDSGDAFVLENNLGLGAELTQPADGVLGGVRFVNTTDRVEFDPLVGLDFTPDLFSINGFVEITYTLGGIDLTPNGVEHGTGMYQVSWQRIPERTTGSAPLVGILILADGAQSVAQFAEEGTVLLPLNGDPTNVDELFLKFQPINPASGDRYRITDFRIVPEPSTASLLVLGLTCLAARRRGSA